MINEALVEIQALRHRQHELITYKDDISVFALNIVDKEMKKIRFSTDGDLQQRDTQSVCFGSIFATRRWDFNVCFLVNCHSEC